MDYWDENICAWNQLVMGLWPFGNPFPEQERLKRKLAMCLEDLDSFLDNEKYLMDLEQAALDDYFDA